MVIDDLQNGLFHHLSRGGGRLTCWLCHRSSFLPCLKMGVTLAFLQSLGTSPILHGFSKVVENSRVTTPVSSLRTHGGIPSGFADLCMLSLPSWSLTQPSMTWEKSSFLWPSLIPEFWGSWEPSSAVKTEAKKAFGVSSFSVSSITRTTIWISSSPTVLLIFLFLLMYLWSPSWCSWCPLPDLIPSGPWPFLSHPCLLWQFSYSPPIWPVPFSTSRKFLFLYWELLITDGGKDLPNKENYMRRGLYFSMVLTPQPAREVIFLLFLQVTEHLNITGTSQQLGSSVILNLTQMSIYM